MSYTTQEILDAVNTAIFQICSGASASWTVNGQTYTALDLDKLRSLKTDLTNSLGTENNDATGLGAIGVSFR